MITNPYSFRMTNEEKELYEIWHPRTKQNANRQKCTLGWTTISRRPSRECRCNICMWFISYDRRRIMCLLGMQSSYGIIDTCDCLSCGMKYVFRHKNIPVELTNTYKC